MTVNAVVYKPLSLLFVCIFVCIKWPIEHTSNSSLKSFRWQLFSEIRRPLLKIQLSTDIEIIVIVVLKQRTAFFNIVHQKNIQNSTRIFHVLG